MPLLNRSLTHARAHRSRCRRSRPPDAAATLSDARPLRIALVTEYYYPHLGGVCEHVHFFAREARRRGHHVDIITSNIPGAGQQPHVIRLGRSQPVYANGSQARITLGPGAAEAICGDVLSVGQYDIVHVHSPLSPVLPLLAIEEADCPVVGTFHTYFDRSFGYTLGTQIFPEAARHAARGDRRLALHDGRAQALLRGRLADHSERDRHRRLSIRTCPAAAAAPQRRSRRFSSSDDSIRATDSRR